MAAGQSGKQEVKVGIIIQARMGSTRLPNKVLMPLGTSNLLQVLVERLKLSGLPIVLATSDFPENNSLEEAASQLGISCYRGSEEDVLSRYYEAAKANSLEVIVRVTGDNPLIDGAWIRSYTDQYVQMASENLYMSTSIGKTLPIGMSFEIFHFKMLEAAWSKATDPREREHVTPFFYTNPALYDMFPVAYEVDRSMYRLTVDTAEDLKLISILIEKYHADQLSYKDIISILDEEQSLSKINTHIPQKKWNE